MKTCFPIMTLLVFVLVHGVVNTAEPIDNNRFSSAEITGKIGVPLGIIAKIEGEIIDGDKTGDYGDWKKFLIMVKNVNGNNLSNPVAMQFNLSPTMVGMMASTKDEIWRLVGDKNVQLSAEQRELAIKSYVGKNITLFAIESASISGIRQQPADPGHKFGIWQGGGYTIYNYLVVLQLLE